MTNHDKGARTTPETNQPNAKTDWGIPDWRDDTSYGKTDGWSDNRWRWEFFRRRKDLRCFFDRWAESSLKLKTNENFTPRDAGFLAFGKEGAEGDAIRRFDYAGVPNPRIGAQPAFAIMPFSQLTSKKRYYDPDRREPSARGVLEAVGKRTAKEYHLLLEPHEMAIKFDLNAPIAPQLKDARDMLRRKQKTMHGKYLQTRQHHSKWLLYLRVLDARAKDVVWREIAEIMPSTTRSSQQSARDVWKQARRLSDTL